MASSFHFYNNGLHTASKGITVDAVRIGNMDETPGAAVTCDIEEDCKSGLISQVIHSATGTFDFYLTKPYPPKLVICQPELDCAAVTTDILKARYKQDSYDYTTGTFTVLVSNDDDSGAPVAADPAATDSMHVLLMFNRYTH